jgi:nucleoside phosphorylase
MPKRKRSQIDFTDDVATRECMSPDTNGQSIDDYTVGWICALQEEYDSACRMLDEEFDDEEVDEADDNSYTFGRIGPYHVVVGCLPAGVYGTNSAARVARDMVRSFPRLRFALLVGIAGGLPTAENDVRLGDVVVSMPHGSFSGVVQYDMGKHLPGGRFQRTGYLNAPPEKLLGVLPVLRRRYNDPKQPDRIAEHVHRMDDMPDYRRPVTDCLYHADYPHQSGRDCSLCDRKYLIPRAERRGRLVAVHYGTIASGNSLIKDAAVRDEIARSEMKPLCFEMEAAGLMNSLPCLVIRGICDYADSHKNDIFHKYAALAAAAYARELLLTLKQSKVVALPGWVDEVRMCMPFKSFLSEAWLIVFISL